MDILTQIKTTEDVIIDPFVIVDSQRIIIHFNRAFYSMLPRGVARGLKGKKIDDVIEFSLSDQGCVLDRCWQEGKHLRLDEIGGQIKKSDKLLTFILSALPFFDPEGNPSGLLLVMRNVTDEAQVQIKYQEMLDNAKRDREELEELVRQRTKDLLKTSQELLTARRELLDFRRGRLG